MRWRSLKPTFTLFGLLSVLSVLGVLPSGSAALAATPAPRWQPIAQHGDVPPPLYEAGASFSRAILAGDTVYRFGGTREDAEEDVLVNDFYSLDLATLTWKNLGGANTPAARANTLLIPGPCVFCVSIVGGRGEFDSGVMFPEMQTWHVLTGRWSRVPAGELGSAFAVTRAAALVVPVPDARLPGRTTFYAFGGVGSTAPGFPTQPGELRNDVAVYNPDNGWHIVKTFGEKPAPRAWTTGGYDPATRSLLVFGGYRLGPDQGPDTPGSEVFGPTNFENDLWSLSLDTFTWTELHPEGPLPTPRDNVTAFFDTAHGWLVTFGGENSDRVKNDLWYYSRAANRWTQVPFATTAPVPPGRVGGVSFVRETGDAFELYLHSGITNLFGTGVLLNDLWKLTWPKH
jgi:hypothetical protein